MQQPVGAISQSVSTGAVQSPRGRGSQLKASYPSYHPGLVQQGSHSGSGAGAGGTGDAHCSPWPTSFLNKRQLQPRSPLLKRPLFPSQCQGFLFVAAVLCLLFLHSLSVSAYRFPFPLITGYANCCRGRKTVHGVCTHTSSSGFIKC